MYLNILESRYWEITAPDKQETFLQAATDYLLWYVAKFHDVSAFIEDVNFVKFRKAIEKIHSDAGRPVTWCPKWYWHFLGIDVCVGERKKQ